MTSIPPKWCNYKIDCGGQRRAVKINVMGALLWTLIIGLVIGAIAKLLMPGKDPGGCIITMLIGVAGAFVAGYLGRALGWYQPDQAAGFIASVIGAMLLLLIYRIIAGKRS